jgi:hypothetical protein
VHGTGVYSARVDPKGPALEKFPNIKKKKKKYRILIRFAISCHYDTHLFLNGLLLNDVCVYNFVELEENSIPM